MCACTSVCVTHSSSENWGGGGVGGGAGEVSYWYLAGGQFSSKSYILFAKERIIRLNSDLLRTLEWGYETKLKTKSGFIIYSAKLSVDSAKNNLNLRHTLIFY